MHPDAEPALTIAGQEKRPRLSESSEASAPDREDESPDKITRSAPEEPRIT